MIIKKFFKTVFMLVFWLLEIVARGIVLLLPLGFYVFFLQMRKNVDKLPALTGYFDPDSTWQMVYKGVVIVNTDPGAVDKRFSDLKKWFISKMWWWVGLVLIVITCLTAYIAYKIH